MAEGLPGRMLVLALEAGLLLIRSSPRRYPLPEAALRERVAAAWRIGTEASAVSRRRWPAATAEQVARELGLSVSEEASSFQGTGASRLRLAAFVPGRGITLYRDGVQALEQVLRAWLPERVAGEGQAREVLVAHELFHVLARGAAGKVMGGWRPSDLAVARRLGYPARFLGIRFRAAIPELDEVAAHAFSTAWARLPVPALLLHACLSARYDAAWASWCQEHGVCQDLTGEPPPSSPPKRRRSSLMPA